eukprot:snap_masked-scaffold_12-processed-gene-1.24-mRNA-1 protein AED:1.00 eAED:1.00 QI:0/0/0/0/1/1/2/0/1009
MNEYNYFNTPPSPLIQLSYLSDDENQKAPDFYHFLNLFSMNSKADVEEYHHFQHLRFNFTLKFSCLKSTLPKISKENIERKNPFSSQGLLKRYWGDKYRKVTPSVLILLEECNVLLLAENPDLFVEKVNFVKSSLKKYIHPILFLVHMSSKMRKEEEPENLLTVNRLTKWIEEQTDIKFPDMFNREQISIPLNAIRKSSTRLYENKIKDYQNKLRDVKLTINDKFSELGKHCVYNASALNIASLSDELSQIKFLDVVELDIKKDGGTIKEIGLKILFLLAKAIRLEFKIGNFYEFRSKLAKAVERYESCYRDVYKLTKLKMKLESKYFYFREIKTVASILNNRIVCLFFSLDETSKIIPNFNNHIKIYSSLYNNKLTNVAKFTHYEFLSREYSFFANILYDLKVANKLTETSEMIFKNLLLAAENSSKKVGDIYKLYGIVKSSRASSIHEESEFIGHPVLSENPFDPETESFSGSSERKQVVESELLREIERSCFLEPIKLYNHCIKLIELGSRLVSLEDVKMKMGKQSLETFQFFSKHIKLTQMFKNLKLKNTDDGFSSISFAIKKFFKSRSKNKIKECVSLILSLLKKFEERANGPSLFLRYNLNSNEKIKDMILILTNYVYLSQDEAASNALSTLVQWLDPSYFSFDNNTIRINASSILGLNNEFRGRTFFRIRLIWDENLEKLQLGLDIDRNLPTSLFSKVQISLKAGDEERTLDILNEETLSKESSKVVALQNNLSGKMNLAFLCLGSTVILPDVTCDWLSENLHEIEPFVHFCYATSPTLDVSVLFTLEKSSALGFYLPSRPSCAVISKDFSFYNEPLKVKIESERDLEDIFYQVDSADFSVYYNRKELNDGILSLEQAKEGFAIKFTQTTQLVSDTVKSVSFTINVVKNVYRLGSLNPTTVILNTVNKIINLLPMLKISLSLEKSLDGIEDEVKVNIINRSKTIICLEEVSPSTVLDQIVRQEQRKAALHHGFCFTKYYGSNTVEELRKDLRVEYSVMQLSR